MINLIKKIKNIYFYATESMKNRYPCKIIKIRNLSGSENKIIITYQAVTRLNIRESSIEKLLEDRLLVEKFHPFDSVKLGFLSAGDIFLKKDTDVNEIKRNYLEILRKFNNESM